MAARRKASPLMGAATAMLEGVSDAIVRDESRFQHSMELALSRVRPDPDQPRKTFDADEIAALAGTMAEQGQLQPILVRRDAASRGQWLIVAGERRWRAANTAGWPTILAIEHTGDAEVATLVENLQRVDLGVIEEARGLQRLIGGKGWSQAQAAQALGKSEAEISSTLRILTLPDSLLHDLLATKGSEPSRYVLAELARIGPGAVRERLIQAARDGSLTQKMVRAARATGAVEPAPAPARQPRNLRHLSVETIDSFRDGLRRLTEHRQGITTPERKRLKQLRAEIDQVLAATEPP
jgi:ParB family chromosome partitioning protein